VTHGPHDPIEEPALADRIRREIRDDGPLTFARFMERALFDPRGGYYSGGAHRLGPAGDYFTASDVGSFLGACVAEQLWEIDAAGGPFDPFDVIEFGAGRGLLARDVLDTLAGRRPELASRVRYRTVDRSAAMRDHARRTAPAAEALDPAELGEGHQGCVLAVELFDALPVHRLRRHGGTLVEVYVGLDDAGRLIEVEAEPTSGAAAMAERYGAAAADGTEAEVAPSAGDMLDRMVGCLDRGVLVIVDYGQPASELYGAQRPRGTLLAHHRHRINEAYLERVGEQDLTAHVNFTALEDRARERGLTVLGCTTQDRFLIQNGILEAFEAGDGAWAGADRVRGRLRAMQLLHPSGMGRAFRVLMFSKGLGPLELAGLADPFGRNTRSP